DAAENLGQFVGESSREVTLFRPRAIRCGLSRGRDRGRNCRPHGQNDDDADGDDLDCGGSAAATGIGGEQGGQLPGSEENGASRHSEVKIPLKRCASALRRTKPSGSLSEALAVQPPSPALDGRGV